MRGVITANPSDLNTIAVAFDADERETGGGVRGIEVSGVILKRGVAVRVPGAGQGPANSASSLSLTVDLATLSIQNLEVIL